MSTHPDKQKGFTLVSTIFIIVVLAVLGSFISVLAMVQHVSSAQSLEGVKGYYAAYSGMEWAIFHATAPTGSHAAVCPSLGYSNTPNVATVDGFTIDVECDSASVTEGAAYYVDKLTVTASKGILGNPDYVTRKIEATVTP